jgi:hypothetical protein
MFQRKGLSELPPQYDSSKICIQNTCPNDKMFMNKFTTSLVQCALSVHPAPYCNIISGIEMLRNV